MSRTIVLALLLTAGAAAAQTVNLQPLSTGSTQKRGGYMPQHAKLSPDKPSTIKKLPDGLAAPMFGVLPIGPASEGGGSVFHIVVDEPEGKDAVLLVDANGNGDLTDAPRSSGSPSRTRRARWN